VRPDQSLLHHCSPLYTYEIFIYEIHVRAETWERAVVLILGIILIVAAVAVYAIWAVKPKRIKFRAGVLKIVTVDFEADAGSPDEPVVNAPSDQPKELPPGRHHRR
jgi:hypothetical protein